MAAWDGRGALVYIGRRPARARPRLPRQLPRPGAPAVADEVWRAARMGVVRPSGDSAHPPRPRADPRPSACGGALGLWARPRGRVRARSHCRFVPLILFIPDSLTYSVSLFLKRQCDRTLGRGGHPAAGRRPAGGRLQRQYPVRRAGCGLLGAGSQDPASLSAVLGRGRASHTLEAAQNMHRVETVGQVQASNMDSQSRYWGNKPCNLTNPVKFVSRRRLYRYDPGLRFGKHYDTSDHLF